MVSSPSPNTKLPNDLFFEAVIHRIQQGEQVSILVQGHSMRPFFENMRDKVVLTAADTQNLHRGQIVLFHYRDQQYILHRIVRRQGDQLFIRGDGLRTHEIANIHQVVAVVQKVIYPSRTISCRSFGWRVASDCWMRLFFMRRILLALYRRYTASIKIFDPYKG